MYRKALGFEELKNFALLIIILVVVVAILFKVPGLADKILGFLKGKFGEGVTEGKALHVRIDPEDKEIFEFYLTDGTAASNWPEIFGNDKTKVVPSAINSGYDADKKLFYSLKNAPAANCIIFATNENDRGATDWGYIYFVKPGSVVQEECSNIGECVDVAYRGCEYLKMKPDKDTCVNSNCVRLAYCSANNCKSIVGNCCMDPNNYVQATATDTMHECLDIKNYIYCVKSEVGTATTFPGIPPYIGEIAMCDKEEKVLTFPFTEQKNYEWLEGCKNSQNCNLLVQEEKTYQVKYGLLCSYDQKSGAIWQACTDEKVNNKITITGGSTYKCGEKGDIFMWEDEGGVTPTQGSCSDGIQNQGETGIDCGGPCKACTGPPPIPPTPPVCGNGKCESGESNSNCPADCPITPPTPPPPPTPV